MTMRGRNAAQGHRDAKTRVRRSRSASQSRPAFLARWVQIDHKSLLLTTALTTTLIFATTLGSTRAAAADCAQPASPAPINDTQTAPITPCFNAGICTNAAGDAIFLSTTGDDNFVDLTNIFALDASEDGIDILTTGDDAPITIDNDGAIDAGLFGIIARTNGDRSGITIGNGGTIFAAQNEPNDESGGSFSDGIYAFTVGGDSDIVIVNTGDITVGGGFVPIDPNDPVLSVASRGVYDGIYAVTVGGNSSISLTNGGIITTNGGEAIDVRTYGGTASYTIPASTPVPDAIKVGPANSPVTIINTGDIFSDDDGIEVCTAGLRFTNCRGGGGNSPVQLTNSGHIVAAYVALDAVTYGPDSPITFNNTGAVVTGEESLDAETSGDGSFIVITNTGDINSGIDGISAATSAYAQGNNSAITIDNSGAISAGEVGIYASTGQNFVGDQSPISITNSGDIVAGFSGFYAHTDGTITSAASAISIANSGAVTSSTNLAGISYAGISVVNAGDIATVTSGITIVNDGTITPGAAHSAIEIVNEGSITASSGLAIEISGTGTNSTTIINEGVVAGFVDLSDQADQFNNLAEATFEAQGTSDFGGDDDVVNNAGEVHTARDPDTDEATVFDGLEVFNNSGLVSLRDGAEGDTFTLSGDFSASDGSTLAVDTFLGGPGSTSDVFDVQGDVEGTTAVLVRNTSTSGGAPGAVIPVVTVAGDVDEGENTFFLQNGPVDGGFFSYDLFCNSTPCQNNVAFELRSFAGPGAFLLPQIVTATQDIWHVTSDAWFERTADLRVLMRGEGVHAVSLKDTSVAGTGRVAPGPWARASAEWLERDGSATTQAFNRSYNFDLDRELHVRDFQVGYDFAKRGVLQGEDTLVVGILGGAVDGKLDYDNVNRRFEFAGGQIGAYATYMNRNLFVDALVKADFLKLETETPGLPGSLDAQTVGVRVDAGYRLSAPSFFIEPLATLAAAWTNVDDFSNSTNSVNFDEDTSLRGRLGVRLGTTLHASEETTIEPFLIASLWSQFAGDNRASLTSLGQPYTFSDAQDEVWGEVSAGVNLYTAGNIAAFAKADVTLGDEIAGLGGQIGVRVTGNLFGESKRKSEAPERTSASTLSGGDCCANLEQRVAELEAMSARKGNRQIELTIGGTVSHALLYWDDGEKSDTYVVGNDNDGTSFELQGEAKKIGGGSLSAGFTMEVGVLDAQSSEVSQVDPKGTKALEINESHVWIGHEQLGRLSWGQIGGSKEVDDATEMDLSETKVVAFSSASDIGGGFFLRRADFNGLGGLSSVTWGDLIDHLPGVDGDLVRYDTPNLNGLSGWAEWGRDDAFEVVMSYHDPDPNEESDPKEKNGAGEEDKPQSYLINGLQIAAALSYHGFNGEPDLPDNRTLSGSVSVLHPDTGLSLTVAGGNRDFTQPLALNDGTTGKLQDASYYYAKPGLMLDLSELGKTAFYAEYGKWRNFLGRNADTEAVSGLAGITEGHVCAAGEACLVSGSEATIMGFGVVQHIESAEMQLYLAFRQYEPEVELVDKAGNRVPSVPLEDLVTVMGGAIIDF